MTPSFPKNSKNRGFKPPIQPRRREGHDDSDDVSPALRPAASEKALLAQFEKLWRELMTTSVHLDSLLSKQTPKMKSLLAQLTPLVLLRPASQAEALGVGMPPGEPWSIADNLRANWRPALLIAKRQYEEMARGILRPTPVSDDFPPQMLAEWREGWGEKITEDLIRVLGSEPGLGIRAAQSIGADALRETWSRAGTLPVRMQNSTISPTGLSLSGYAPVLKTEQYAKGQFEIQDEGSQLMALFALWPEIFGSRLQKTPGSRPADASLPPKLPKETPAWTVIDACAGAGGKTLAMADALRGKGRVYSYDTVAGKLQALRRRVARAGLTNIQSVVAPEGKEESLVGKFRRRADRVLVDAPCSGWGVLRRNPDIKWRQTQEVLDRMPKLQLRILEVYSGLVAPGGRLTYGVCTFRKAETLEVIEEFSKLHPEFEKAEGGFLGPGPCDGFFMQSFVRGKG